MKCIGSAILNLDFIIFAMCLQSFILDGVIEDISKLLADGTPSADDILSEARQIQF